MLIKLSQLIYTDIIWLPLISSLYVFLYVFFLTKDFHSRLLAVDNVKTRKIIRIQRHKYLDNYSHLLIFFCKFIAYFFLLIFVINTYHYSLSAKSIFYSFSINNLSWYYGNFILALLIVSFLIITLLTRANLVKSFELLLGVVLVFVCIYYYIIINNFITLIFLFEFQSLVFIYLLANTFIIFNINAVSIPSKNSLNQNQPIWYFNSLLYQFWVSFIGALLLIYGALNLMKFTSFTDWTYSEIFIYFSSFNGENVSPIKVYSIILPIVLGVLLKIGSVPFFLWKPEIYKNFNPVVLFIYMTSYLFGTVFFTIILFSSHYTLISGFFYPYIYIISIISLVIVTFLLYSVVEVRPFLAYSSIIHISFILLSTFQPDFGGLGVSLLYLFTYLLLTLLFFSILFSVLGINFWFLTDLQHLNRFPTLVTAFSIFMLGMAGTPPFLGFFTKFSVIAILFTAQDYLFFFITLISGFFAAFFYIQNYRFYGYSIKSYTYVKTHVTIKYNLKLYLLIYFFVFVNLFSSLLINDFFIFFQLLSII